MTRSLSLWLLLFLNCRSFVVWVSVHLMNKLLMFPYLEHCFILFFHLFYKTHNDDTKNSCHDRHSIDLWFFHLFMYFLCVFFCARNKKFYLMCNINKTYDMCVRHIQLKKRVRNFNIYYRILKHKIDITCSTAATVSEILNFWRKKLCVVC
jgi:hypothetical protein